MKILIAGTRELCYFSGSFFLNRMQEALERTGVEVVRLDFFGDQTDFSELEQYVGTQFDAILDVNSRLPYLIDEKGSRILNQMKAPFFNYIVDHPLYHHVGLSFPIDNYYAIGIDTFHCDYMRECYSNLKEVFLLPLAGTKSVALEQSHQRKKEYLFMGTYLLDDEITHRIQKLRNEINNATYQLALDLYDGWDEEKAPIEHALKKILHSYSGASSKEEVDEFIQNVYELSGFSELLNHMFLVDQRKRNERRLEILRMLAKNGEQIHVFGEGWETTDLTNYSNIQLKRGCEMSYSFVVMSHYEKLLDVNPLFFGGFHDRVLSAMANGCLCISDMVPGLDMDLVNGENIVLYKKKSLLNVLEELSEQRDEKNRAIAMKGNALWKEKYTWEEHAKKLQEIIKSVN